MTRDQAAQAIRNAKTLRQLHDALIAFEEEICGDSIGTMYEKNSEDELAAEGIDICDLPTFGGNEPKSTVEVWSWDADHILGGVGPFRDWRIEAR